ncbi:MAG: hypothetical protein KF752_18610 [Pirellulaceae bacterium]|nr:hypothetical protein [Pirellulaceae bacterium]
MGLIVRLLTALCVATVIAQLMILGIMAGKGNLHKSTVTQALALVNGIDLTGEQLAEVFEKERQVPTPTHEEILDQRARMSVDLQNQQDAIARERETLTKMLAELDTKAADFDRRRQEYLNSVDQLQKKAASEKLMQVQRTIEELAPDQAKDQLIRMLAAERMEEVVAIVKVMDPAKRKKILGEFADREDSGKLHDILMTMLAGEPVANLIGDQHQSSQNTP